MAKRAGLEAADVTLLVHLGEGDDGVARWRAVPMSAVVYAAGRGMRQGTRGARGDVRAQVYWFDREAGRCPLRYVGPAAFDAMGEEARAGCFTMHTDGRDRLYLGWRAGDEGPSRDERTMRVVAVDRRAQGSRGMRHWRLGCV